MFVNGLMMLMKEYALCLLLLQIQPAKADGQNTANHMLEASGAIAYRIAGDRYTYRFGGGQAPWQPWRCSERTPLLFHQTSSGYHFAYAATCLHLSLRGQCRTWKWRLLTIGSRQSARQKHALWLHEIITPKSHANCQDFPFRLVLIIVGLPFKHSCRTYSSTATIHSHSATYLSPFRYPPLLSSSLSFCLSPATTISPT